MTGEFSDSMLTLASQPTMALQPVTVTFDYIGVAHWAELI